MDNSQQLIAQCEQVAKQWMTSDCYDAETQKAVKAMVENPQRMYPALMKNFLFPMRSERIPMKNVVSVAVTADAATMVAIAPESGVISL